VDRLIRITADHCSPSAVTEILAARCSASLLQRGAQSAAGV